ncbi:MAG: ABC transporter substrate-binding protein [Christensenellaceae bacterium]|nr:ABC transporter substrate-binding protein [Christensenellaceae bacterium]
MRFTERSAKFISLLLATVLILCAAGCQKEIETIYTADAPIAEQLPMPEEYKEGERVTELTTTMLRNPATLNPLFVQDEDTKNLLSLVFEPAIRLDASDKPTSSVIESWKYDETGTGIVFNIRKGVKFHGGNGEVTAQDLVYCIEQIMQSESAECPYARYKSIIASYEATSAMQLTVHTAGKTADLFYFMNIPVVTESVYLGRGKTTTAAPIGTGPYSVESYSSEEGMKLVRNEEWWRVPSAIENITAIPVDDNESKIAGYQLGNFNFISATEMTANTYSAMSNTSFYKAVTPYYETLIPNMNNRYLQDQKFRQAISYAIDRREVVSNGVLGGGLATTTALKPNLWYFDGDISLVEYDVATADRLLDELGYYESEIVDYRYTLNADETRKYVKLELIYCESDDLYYRGSVAEQLQKDLKEVGIELILRELPYTEFAEALRTQDFDLAYASFYGKTNNDVSYLFMTGAEMNYGGFSDNELDTLMAASRITIGETEQTELYKKLNIMLNEKLPHIGLYFREYITYADSDLTGIKNLRNGAVFADINEWQ